MKRNKTTNLKDDVYQYNSDYDLNQLCSVVDQEFEKLKSNNFTQIELFYILIFNLIMRVGVAGEKSFDGFYELELSHISKIQAGYIEIPFWGRIHPRPEERVCGPG